MPALIAPLPGLIHALRHFWHWWSGELLAMVPARLRAWRVRGNSPVEITLLREETRIERVRDGLGERLTDARPIATLDDEAWGQLVELIADAPTRLILAPPDVYVTELLLPLRIGPRLAQAVALQMNELAPLPPARLRWKAVPIERAGDQLRVEVAMVRLDRIETLEALFTARGLAMPDVYASAPHGPVPIAVGARSSLGGLRSPWLIALALLLSIPITTTIAASIIAWSNEHRATLVEDTADQSMRAEVKARAVEALRQAIAPLARDPAASQILDELAERLPIDAFLAEAARDEHGTLILAIDAVDPDRVRAVLDADPWFRFTETDERNAADGRLRLLLTGRRR